MAAAAELIYGTAANFDDVVTFDTADTGTLISNYPLSGPQYRRENAGVPFPLTMPSDFPTGADFPALMEVNVDAGVITNLGPIAFATTDVTRVRPPGSKGLRGGRRTAERRPFCTASTSAGTL